ncbi:DUF2399 domain-containing protein [Bacillus benzoevorans]|uniref:Toprim domain-containing protein n=1 Tax=Bacillus benzoevorans TaxID=1456 RepID=A0A7X0HRD9_9BACI|nr:DUF2399 domain-containing protein [Bacillus benzoevorans]MBB6444156.1 hypothetical protein [Bacillus benzoevorans]
MLPEKVQLYIAAYFLRSQEEIDDYQLRDTGDGFFEIPIVKRTAKRRRKTREILINSRCNMDSSELQKISKIFSSPGVRKNWSSEEGDPFIDSGALMRVINYENDEKSVKDIYYVMAPALYEFVKKMEEDDREELDNELKRLRAQCDELQKIPLAEKIPLERIGYMSKIIDLFHELIPSSPEKDKIPAHWRQNKRILFLHFILAFYLQMKTNTQFDWKEIGANYYSEIGGSKKFDTAKKEFLDILEGLDFPPVSIAGLFSLGTIISIPFSGPLTGSMSQFQYGTVHTVTDHDVFTDVFSTNARNLWLVENRGVITRFAYEKDFLKNTNSLVIGVEGQLKSAVKRLVKMVSQSPSIEQILIWTDYDEAGVTIADHIYEVLMAENVQDRTFKWIVPEQPRVATDSQSYHQMLKGYLSNRSGEQEEKMEGVNEWLTWMEK